MSSRPVSRHPRLLEDLETKCKDIVEAAAQSSFDVTGEFIAPFIMQIVLEKMHVQRSSDTGDGEWGMGEVEIDAPRTC